MALAGSRRPEGPQLCPWVGRYQATTLATEDSAVRSRLERLREPLAVLDRPEGLSVAEARELTITEDGWPAVAALPAMPPEALGDDSFAADHGLRFNYAVGAMARGIASVDLIADIAQAGMLAFFGAAGLPIETITSAIQQLQQRALDRPWGVNLINSPYDPAAEAATADLLIRMGVKRASASAYMRLTKPLVAYRLAGIHERDGQIVVPHALVAKVSRVEVARQFMAPPPAKFVQELVVDGQITPEQAQLASQIPLAADLTIESDSGGHTDNRPAGPLFSELLMLRDQMQKQVPTVPLRLGLAGGIGTPHAAAAAFAMGAAYVMTGSINQACIQSGTSDAVRELLAAARSTDVAMAPAADMFEMGVEVQVLKRGTMFATRAHKLWELYQGPHTFDTLSAKDREWLETKILGSTLEEAWADTEAFWLQRDPKRAEAAQADPKRKMALVFRRYLGLASRWANAGDPDRIGDYQIWCGPAMGAFNAWTRGSSMEDWRARDAVAVAHNIMFGAAYLTRINGLRAQGFRLSPSLAAIQPRSVAELEACLA